MTPSKLSLERLEAREVLSQSPLFAFDPTAGVLAVTLQGRGTHTLSVNPGATAGQVSVAADGVAKSFSGVTQLQLTGAQHGKNYIENNTAIAASIYGGAKSDTLFGGSVSDQIFAGAGSDTVYDLVGTNVINTQDGVNGNDQVFTNAASSTLLDKWDRLVTFFDVGRTPGAGTVVLDPATKVLYVTPTNNGSSTAFTTNADGSTLLTYNLGDGNGQQTQTFAKGTVTQIAYFGGTGDDYYRNDTTIRDVAYGSAGNDMLIGGRGDFSLEKGSGGNDTVVGRATKNDLSGNGGSDLLVVAGKTTKKNVFRTDAADLTVGSRNRDIFLGPRV